MSVKVIGLDIAKHVFQVHGGNATGKTPEEAVQRSQLRDFFRKVINIGGR